jgi:hypothetical protein
VFIVIASAAKQSILLFCGEMDCFAARAPLRKRFAFVAGNDDLQVVIARLDRAIQYSRDASD